MMQKEFSAYLGTLGMGEVLIARVAEIDQSATAVCPEPLKGIFVSDYIDQDSNRQYENLYFFTDSFVIEATNFVNEGRFEMDYVKASIINFEFTWQAFDFDQPTDQSRLTLRYTTGALQAYLRASKENCARLVDVFRTYLLPNVGTTSSAASDD